MKDLMSFCQSKQCTMWTQRGEPAAGTHSQVQVLAPLHWQDLDAAPLSLALWQRVERHLAHQVAQVLRVVCGNRSHIVMTRRAVGSGQAISRDRWQECKFGGLPVCSST